MMASPQPVEKAWVASSGPSSNSTTGSEASFVSAQAPETRRPPGSADADRGQSEAPPARVRKSSSPRREAHKPSSTLITTRSPSSARDVSSNGHRNNNNNSNNTTTSKINSHKSNNHIHPDAVHRDKHLDAKSPQPSAHDSPAPLSPPVGSYFTAQPGASGLEARSPPSKRRPPASRSSHGIETLSGPPPALSTQRSHPAESAWRSPPGNDPPNQPALRFKGTEANGSIASILQGTHISKNDRRSSEPVRIAKESAAPDSASADINSSDMPRLRDSPLVEEEDEDTTLRMSLGNSGQLVRRLSSDEGRDPRQDLFLDLARSDLVTNDSPDTVSRSERRRSRLGAQTKHARPSSSGVSASGDGQRTTPLHPHYNSYDPSKIEALLSLRDGMAPRKAYAASAHPLDPSNHSSFRELTAGSSQSPSQNGPGHSISPHQGIINGRRRSIHASSSGNTPLNHAQSNHTKYMSSPFPEPTPPAVGSESTVSTTAPSTVWDELDDIKSRIRKLELTGKLPASSNAAITGAFGDRPTTASTTITNMSTSPKHRQQSSSSPKASPPRTNEASAVHPLLQSAFARAKTVVGSGVSGPLEATVLDALTMASLSKTLRAQSVDRGEQDRHFQKKVDSMCRNLMELCVALAEEDTGSRQAATVATPRTRDSSPPFKSAGASSDTRFVRATTEDPELRSSSRVRSRLEARRASLQATSSGLSPRDASQETPTPVASRLDRASSVLRRGATDEQRSLSKRPLSRAATEGGHGRSSGFARTPREYTASHPLPNQPHRPPSVQASLPARKTYFSSTTSSPGTPNKTWPGSRRSAVEGSTPPSSAEGSRLADARQRRLASLGPSPSTSKARSVLGTGNLRPVETEP